MDDKNFDRKVVTMLKLSVTEAPPKLFCDYNYEEGSLRLCVRRLDCKPSAEDIETIKSTLAKIKSFVPNGIELDLSASDNGSGTWRVAATLSSENVSYTKLTIIDGIQALDELSHNLVSIVKSSLPELEGALKAVASVAEETAVAATTTEEFPHAHLVFSYLQGLNIPKEDIPKVVHLCADRILNRVPTTDTDYRLIYEDLQSPMSWNSVSMLVNLMFERAGKPIPKTHDEMSEGIKALKHALYTAYPQLGEILPKKITFWSHALYYFMHLKIIEGVLRLK